MITGPFWGWHKIIHIKHLAQCLVCSSSDDDDGEGDDDISEDYGGRSES